ncbi:MAG: phage holin family protein [Planctomycetaceae bacterium]|nr:phage holin family protein [Planctomycetaceae bacterium]
MSLLHGTTSRHLSAVTRWALISVIVAAMLGWWWPSLRAWAALIGGLMVVFTFWLAWRITLGDRRVNAHPMYLALLGPAAVLAWHTAQSGMTRLPPGQASLYGGLDISMLFQISLAVLGLLLSGSLLDRFVHNPVIPLLIGLAMVIGPAAGAVGALGRGCLAGQSLALLAWAGLAVLLQTRWNALYGETLRETEPRQRRRMALAVWALAAAIGLLFIVLLPRPAVLAAMLAGGTLLLAGLILPARRKITLGIGLALLVGTIAAATVAPPSWPALLQGVPTTLGQGEQAAREVYSLSGAAAILAAATGWVGFAWMAIGAVGSLVVLLWRARTAAVQVQTRCSVWAVAVVLASAAACAPGGLSIPAVTLAAAVLWGLLPRMAAREGRLLPGVLVMLGLCAVLLAMGLVRDPGLLEYAWLAFGLDPNVLHAPTGFFVALCAAWITGARRVWLGLLGVAAVAAVGWGGEMLQSSFSTRRYAELQDWYLHIAGCMLALIPYLLAMGSRLCELEPLPESVLRRLRKKQQM